MFGICGVEPGPGFDGVSYTLSILCLVHTLVLGFSSRDALLAWDARVRYSLGEVHRFGVTVEPGTTLQSGSASLHLCNNLLALSRGVPPFVIGHWKLSALRRYGAVPNGFVFEGGSRCGYWAGVFFLSCSEGEQISFLFDCIVRGITPSRAPHGLRPNLPDPSADSCSAEERISQETSELEKRLSMLSHCSLASSTGTFICHTSVAADDRSSISSSSSSQSDTSYGSRPFWMEPLSRPPPAGETASSSSSLKTLTGSDDRLFAAVMGGSAGRPASAQPRPRGLHDSGRQSSLDSGIGIGQSSCSGSYSSCTGSLDASSQGGGEEFGSVASLPAAPSGPPPPPHDEYRIPSLLRLWYDTPRSLLHAASPPPPPSPSPSPSPSPAQRETPEAGGGLKRLATMQRSLSWGSERAPSVDSDGSSTPTALLLPAHTQVFTASRSAWPLPRPPLPAATFPLSPTKSKQMFTNHHPRHSRVFSHRRSSP
uniref:Docking protein 7 n=1 Tax=Salarias fasciatus TaxID=181472 RepID=A0A672GB88_SALFA